MSKRFFKYISEMLVRQLADQISPGDRFYLQLDHQEDVEELMAALENLDQVERFNYTHETGSTYNTFAVRVKDVRLVVASTAHGVTPDFLVTLRNEAGDQKGEWENAALFSIVSEQLDSIQGGSSDLQKEGMPLHPQSLYKFLTNEINNSVLEKVDKAILQENLKRLMNDQYLQQVSLLDFKDIFTVLEKGSIENQDYVKFGLFKDYDLENKTGKELKNRLQENYELFEYVQRAHDFGTSIEEDLSKKFSSKGIQELKDENWTEVPFSVVYNSKEEKKRESKDAKVYLSELKIPGFEFWDRPQKETAAGERKRQIIIFNYEHKEEIKIQSRFETTGKIKSLNKGDVRVPNPFASHVEYDVGLKNLTINIKTKPNEVTFARVSYKHNNKASMGAEFHVVVVPFPEHYLNELKTRYTVNPSKQCLELKSDVEELKIGEGMFESKLELEHDEKLVELTGEESVRLQPRSEAFNDQDQLLIKLKIQDSEPLALLFNNELPETTPIRALRIWRLKREMQKNFTYMNKRLVIGNREFYTHAEYTKFLNWEIEWIQNEVLASQIDSDLLQRIELKVDDGLKEAYLNFLNYFKRNSTLPTLAYVSDDYKTLAKEYLEEYIKQVKLIKGRTAKERVDLMRLGTQKDSEGIYLTPLHPLVVAYQLKVADMLGSVEVDQNILERLSSNTLLPYLYDERDQLYKPDPDNPLKEWIKYKPVNEVSVSDASSYLAKVVEDKLKQFEEHFKYLFVEGSKASVKLNVINISNDREVLRGILTWLIERIDKKGPDNINPIEVSLYFTETQDSTFDVFSRLKEPEDVQEELNVKLKSKHYDQHDVLRFVRKSLQYYKFKLNKNEAPRYAHLTFYKMMGEERYAIQPMSSMLTGLSLDGLLSSVPSMKTEDAYKSGFGTKAYNLNADDPLLEVVKLTNELAANVVNQGFNAYTEGQSIMSTKTIDDEETLNKIFSSSYWVTFVDPTVDLSYFQSYNRNLVVIHYSDQYSSSSRYDAITVTDKSTQYHNAINEFLSKHSIDSNNDEIEHIIKGFNAFNGEWLLRIVGSKGFYDKEKLSIISAIKYSLTYFNHPNILWVPVSLEEILRVAGAVGLNKSGGIFTPKSLGVSGSHSDDLLLIGLETVGDEVRLHFYPIEVKIGWNNSHVIGKAKEQLRKTRKLFEDYLKRYDDSGNFSFNRQFYRQFFVQLFIANLNKFRQSDIWPDKKFELSDDVRYKLLSDRFEVSNQLTPLIGKGAIVSFERDRFVRTVEHDEQVTTLNLPEEDGFRGMVEPIDELFQRIIKGETDFQTENLLYNQYKAQKKMDKTNSGDNEDPKHSTANNINDRGSSELPTGIDVNDGGSTPTQVSRTSQNSLEDVRILIGEAEGSNQEIYWEFGNPQLANRHLLISGKSGQGKTYFMQCLLLEQAQNGVSSVIIDYTEGFLPNQLEEEFVTALGDRLNQKIVYNEGFPINPFKRNTRNIGGIELEENPTDVAERIKSVFSAVYSTLGVQQLNAIYEATKNGVTKYGEQMNLTQLRYELDELGTTYAKNTLSQINNLIDRNPFRTSDEEMDWGKLINSDGTVNVVQLTGYPRDVQLMITEFILWDLWNYSVRNGNKNIPIPVVMDEAQNLDHREHSPSARILTEGRKFGWSGWYATQFLKSQLDADELARLQNSSQKIYFAPPEQEISTIANSLSNDKEDKRYWEQKLSSLRKGQCIVHGPIRKENGELTKPITQVVNITSLNKRV